MKTVLRPGFEPGSVTFGSRYGEISPAKLQREATMLFRSAAEEIDASACSEWPDYTTGA
jgi:hypothetical protein